MQAAAFFDLDKTIIAKSSTLAYRRQLYQAGFLNLSTLLKLGVAQTFYVLFGASHDQMERIRESLTTLVKGWDRDTVERIVSETLDEVVEPLVYAEALFLIDEHHREGDRVVIVSSSPIEIVRPLGRYLGVTDVIATELAIDRDGLYSGGIDFYAYGPTKADAIHKLAVEGDIDLSRSFAYSDSFTDVPMMEAVGNPVAVNPDRDLRAKAEAEGWPIKEFKLPVNMRTRLGDVNRPSPLVSSAAVLGSAALIGLAIVLRSRKRLS